VWKIEALGILEGFHFSTAYVFSDALVESFCFFSVVELFSSSGGIAENIDDLEDFIFSQVLEDIFGSSQDEFVWGAGLW
jgi:hypothetical protein